MTIPVRLPVSLRQTHTATGARLAYLDCGDPEAPPVVLVHGWAQAAASWGEGVLRSLGADLRVIAPDLRGHGASEPTVAGYDDPSSWATDLETVLDAARVTVPVLLVGWSYGGLVCTDLVATRGTARVAGLVLVGGITGIGRGVAGGRVGRGMREALPGALAESPVEAIRALGGFGAAMMPPGSGSGEARQRLCGQALVTPPSVRAALFAREIDNDAVLAAFDRPALVLHGTADGIVDPVAAEHNARLLRAEISWWEGGGHAPFAEDPERFVAELRGFHARRIAVAPDSQA